VLSPVTGLFCHRHSREVCPGAWRQRRGARTTRFRSSALAGVRRPPIPASTASHRNVRDVRNAPLIGWDGANWNHWFARRRKRNIFARGAWH